MILNNANVQALNYAVHFKWQEAFASQGTTYEPFVSTVPSSGEGEYYAWMDAMPGLREWLGERQYINLANRSYFLANRRFERSVELPRVRVEDDRFNQFVQFVIPGLARAAKLHPDELFTDLLENGDSSSSTRYQAYDGQPFFNGSHPKNLGDSGAGTYSNKLTSTALTATNLATAYTTMTSYVGSDGQPLQVRPNILMVPTALTFTARTIVNATVNAPSTGVGGNANGIAVPNILSGLVDVVVNPRLTSATTWYLLDTTKVVKPFVYQTRTPAELISRDKPSDPNVFERDMLQWGVRLRDAMGYSLPYLALKATA